MASPFGTRGPRHALTVLSRIAQRKPSQRHLLERFLEPRLETLAETALEVVIETGEPLGEVLADALEQSAEPGLTERVAERVMVRFESAVFRASPALRRTGLVVTRKVLESWLDREERTLRRTHQLTYLWHNLAYWLDAMGRRKEALDASGKALACARSLTARKPERSRLRYAICLETYCARQEDAGHTLKAVEERREAIAIFREAAAAAGDSSALVDLARVLARQAQSLGRLNRHEEAIQLLMEAVEIRRRLVEESVAHEAALAKALDATALRMNDAGRHEEALAHANEAAALAARLAAEQPGLYSADSARSLSNRSISQRDAGDPEGALDSCREARVWIERARAASPGAFDQHLASILVNESRALMMLGRLDESLDAIDEAVAIRRPSAEGADSSSLDRLALTLATRSIVLERSGRFQDALSSLDEAIEIRRPLAAGEPDVFGESLEKNLRSRRRLARHLERPDRSAHSAPPDPAAPGSA